jgi:hypothetical protein
MLSMFVAKKCWLRASAILIIKNLHLTCFISISDGRAALIYQLDPGAAITFFMFLQHFPQNIPAFIKNSLEINLVSVYRSRFAKDRHKMHNTQRR